MIKRIFAFLLVAGLLSACGDGGTTNPPPAPVGDPAINPQQPKANPNRPAENPNQAPSNAGGAPSVDDGNHGGDDNGHGHAGSGNPGPGKGCTAADGCAGCKNNRDICVCSGIDQTICDQI